MLYHFLEGMAALVRLGVSKLRFGKAKPPVIDVVNGIEPLQEGVSEDEVNSGA